MNENLLAMLVVELRYMNDLKEYEIQEKMGMDDISPPKRVIIQNGLGQIIGDSQL